MKNVLFENVFNFLTLKTYFGTPCIQSFTNNFDSCQCCQNFRALVLRKIGVFARGKQL